MINMNVELEDNMYTKSVEQKIESAKEMASTLEKELNEDIEVNVFSSNWGDDAIDLYLHKVREEKVEKDKKLLGLLKYGTKEEMEEKRVPLYGETMDTEGKLRLVHGGGLARSLGTPEYEAVNEEYLTEETLTLPEPE